MLYVIMSVYRNDEPTALKEAVDSILVQTYRDFRLHMICDGPVPEGIKNYLSSLNDPRVSVKYRDENLGLAVSLNELLEEILRMDDCEYVARMDADDYSLPNRFETQVRYLIDHPNVDIVGSYIKESSDPTIDGGNLVKYPLNHTGCKLIFGKRNPVAHVSVMIREHFFYKAGLYPANNLRGEDEALWLKAFKAGCRFANIPDVLIRVRVNDSFYERRNSPEKTKQDYKFRNKIIQELELPKSNYIYSFFRYMLFRYAPAPLLKYAYVHLRP